MSTRDEATGTDPGSKSAAEIEREVRELRAEVEHTLDQIQDRLSPGQLFDQAVTYFRDGGGGEFTRNFGESIKQNPMPLALVALGVGWMMFSGQRSAQNGDRWRSTDRYDDPDNVGERYAASDYGHGSYLAEDPAYRVSGADEGSESGFGGRLKQASHTARDKLGEVGEEVGDQVRGLGDRAREFGEQARDFGTRARGGIAHAGSGLADRAHDAGDRARYYGRHARRSMLQTLNEQPLVLGAIGLAVGAALGAALPSTEIEDEVMGDTRDDMIRRAKETGREQAGKAASAAEAVVTAAREEAGKQGLTPKSPDDPGHAAAGQPGGVGTSDDPGAGKPAAPVGSTPSLAQEETKAGSDLTGRKPTSA